MPPLITSHPDAFPVAPPPDLDDPGSITAHDWRAFDTLTEMQNHWQRPGWTSSTRAYYWLLTISDEPAFVAQARRCQDAVRHLQAFDLIDSESFHLTLGRIADANTVDEALLFRLAENVQAIAPAAFTLSALPLTGSRGALRYSVAPWSPIVGLLQLLVAASASCGLPHMKSSSRLRPHIGIGYCGRKLPAEPVHEAVRPLRSLPPTELLIDHVDLVEMRREGASYRWRVVHTVDLPQAASLRDRVI
ncbi:2'-5' RNA ligase family protein [Streptomyces sp. NPDC047042]|uniref:2'-5' RNA ligase family protein n=1 Tax=Streptomyces sp. NPDC047042 TaxID=3154807 RepID=UPI0033F0E409